MAASRMRSPGLKRSASERERIALRDYEQDARETGGHACELRSGEPVAKHAPRHQRNEHRPGRVPNQAIQRRGGNQPEIEKRVVARRPDQPKKQQDAAMLQDFAGILAQAGPGKGQKEERGQHPAQAGERDGRDGPGDRAAHDDVSGPEHRRQRQKQARAVEKWPQGQSFLAGCGSGARSRRHFIFWPSRYARPCLPKKPGE